MHTQQVEFQAAQGLVAYTPALAFMQERVEQIITGQAQEMLWFLEHPPLYTAGTSAKAEELILHDQFPVHNTGRGGKYTYHGPMQRVGYVMLDLKTRADNNGQPDLRLFIKTLEQWIIDTLLHFDVLGERRAGRIGIWVQHKGQDEKIAAIGIRLRKWISYHGVAVNVAPDLTHFNGIIPCGIGDYGVTSLAKLGINVTMEEFDYYFKQEFDKIFHN